MVDNFFRDDVIAREVADSQDLKQISLTACTAYETHAFEAQDGSHDYEAIPLKNLPPLPPARASNPTSPVQKSGQYENLPASSAQEDELDCSSVATPTPLLSAEKSSDSDEHTYELTCAPSSAATPTETAAARTVTMPTTTSPQDTEYEEVEHDMQM